MTRTNAGTTPTFPYRGAGEVLAKAQGATTTTYASTALGAPLAEKTGPTTLFALRDVHGDVVGRTLKVSTKASIYGHVLRTGSAAERSAAAGQLTRYGRSMFDDLARSSATSGLVRSGARWLPDLGAGVETSGSTLPRVIRSPRPEPRPAAGSPGARPAWAGAGIGCAVAGPVGCVGGAIIGGVIGNGLGSAAVDHVTDFAEGVPIIGGWFD